MPLYKRIGNILRISTQQFFARDYLYEASALSFTTLLSLVPALSVCIYILSIFPFFDKLFILAKHYIFNNFIPSSGAVIEKYLDEFSQQASNLPKTSMIFLALSILMLVNLIKNVINHVWQSPKYLNIRSAILHYLAILIMPMLFALCIYISNAIMGLYWITQAADTLGVQILLSGLLVLGIEILSFTFLYFVMPNCPVNWKDCLLGGFVASILFEIAKFAFVFYIQTFPSYELIYGALAVVPIFLLWLYISWSVVILGAIVSNIAANERIASLK